MIIKNNSYTFFSLAHTRRSLCHSTLPRLSLLSVGTHVDSIVCVSSRLCCIISANIIILTYHRQVLPTERMLTPPAPHCHMSLTDFHCLLRYFSTFFFLSTLCAFSIFTRIECFIFLSNILAFGTPSNLIRFNGGDSMSFCQIGIR